LYLVVSRDKIMKSEYLPIIGVEVHIELSTKSKMFCGCPALHFGTKPNSQVCAVCLGLPGSLPYPNKKAIDYTIKFGSVFDCKISNYSKFDRKHYFYPDLPKSFQISQYDLPFTYNGKLEITGGSLGEKGNSKLEIGIRRVHLEEDTGKLIHKDIDEKRYTLIDFNRSGVPLLEMVTEPDFRNISDVVVFLKEVQLIARYMGISTADMEKGSMRLEANISLAKVKKSGSTKDKNLPDYKVELKNINSFKFLEKALKAEIKRQEKLLSEGKNIVQETRGFNETLGETYSQRTKEEEQDYRYFPEPDIPPLNFDNKYIQSATKKVGLLPKEYRKIFSKDYSLSDNYVSVLVSKKERAEYFVKSVNFGKKLSISPKLIADMVVNNRFDEKYPEPSSLVRAIHKLGKKQYSSIADVKRAVVVAIKDNKKAVKDFQGGKFAVVGFLMGVVQKHLKGNGNPNDIKNELLKQLQK